MYNNFTKHTSNESTSINELYKYTCRRLEITVKIQQHIFNLSCLAEKLLSPALSSLCCVKACVQVSPQNSDTALEDTPSLLAVLHKWF